MNRFYIFALVASVFAACSQGVIEEHGGANSVLFDVPETIYAQIDESDTRTYVERDNHLRWTENDEISYFPGVTYNLQYRFDGETGANSGSFTRVTDKLVTGNALDNTYALYPYKDATSMSDEGVIGYEFAATQSYAENSFGLGDNVMVAVTDGKDDNILRFKNVCGFLKLRIYGDANVAKITFAGNNNEPLTGNATITALYGVDPVVELQEGAGETITLNCESGVSIGDNVETATEFWFVVPAQTFEGGFTINITTAEGSVMTKTTNNKVVISRNAILPMEAFEFAATNGPSSKQIWYTNGSTTEPITPYKSNVFGANIVSNTYDSTKECWVITFDANVTSIGENAFQFCYDLEEMIIPNSVVSIGSYAFNNCSALSHIEIPNSVTTIGSYAFNGCKSLTNVDLPDGLTVISDHLFNFCNLLAEVDIPATVKTIDAYAFNFCYALADIQIPEDVTSIGDYAFNGCEKLAEITIPSSVLSLGSSAFNNCEKLADVYCKPATPPTLGNDRVFGGNADGRKIYVPYKSYYDYVGAAVWSNYEPDIVAYDYEKGQVVEPESVKSNQIWYTATAKVELQTTGHEYDPQVVSNEWNSVSGRGVITFDADITSVYGFIGKTALTSVTLPEGVTSICASAFQGCSNLTSINIPEGVEQIFDYAFTNCTNLAEIILPDALEYVGVQSFAYCTSLKDLTIMSGVLVISSGAFMGCSGLETATLLFDENSGVLDQQAFMNCTSLKAVAVAGGLEQIGTWAFSGCSNLLEVTMNHTEKLSIIGDGAFTGCRSMQRVIIPSSVVYIGKEAFFLCTSLEEVICTPAEPPVVSLDETTGLWNAFGDNASGRKIFVDPASEAKYRAADGWKEYASDIIGGV